MGIFLYSYTRKSPKSLVNLSGAHYSKAIFLYISRLYPLVYTKGVCISSYNIYIKPPCVTYSYIIHIIFTFVYCQIVAPIKIIKIIVDKSLIRVYNINRCTLKGHTYTFAYTYATGVITKLHHLLGNT